MNRRWPYPGDSPVARARRCALAYRQLAERHAPPHEVADLDRRLTHWGEPWVSPTPITYDDDDWITASQAADLVALAPGTIGALRRRGRLTGRRRPDGSYEYQPKEVLALLARRTRTTGATDTINTDGTAVPTAGNTTP